MAGERNGRKGKGEEMREKARGEEGKGAVREGSTGVMKVSVGKQ